MQRKEQTLSFSAPLELLEFDRFEKFVTGVMEMIGEHGEMVDSQIGHGKNIMQFNQDGLVGPDAASIEPYAKDGLITYGFTFLATDKDFSDVLERFLKMHDQMEQEFIDDGIFETEN